VEAQYNNKYRDQLPLNSFHGSKTTIMH